MLNFIAGYKTYATLVIMILHQALKLAGYDVVDADISLFIDSILAALAVVFRYVAKPKAASVEPPIAA